MIKKDEMMDRLLEVCPSFQPKWKAFLDYWQDESDELPLYLVLADFARHLISMLESSENKDFPTIFKVIEQLQIEGDDYVTEAVVFGLLEDLQNLNFHSKTKPKQFRRYFGPVTKKAWKDLYEYWERIKAKKAAELKEPESRNFPQIDLDSINDPELRKIVESLFRKG